MKAVIAAGSGRYADPWHPFAATSRLLAGVLRAADYDVTVYEDVDGAMQQLDDVQLLVVNAGDPWRGADNHGDPPRASRDGLTAALQRGIGVLAMHCAVASLRDYPEWAPAVGAIWLPGTSWHPDADLAIISGGVLPNGEAVADFSVFDERYCRLQRVGQSDVAATHSAGHGSLLTEPTAWARKVGASRVAVDVLGHDERSYASEGHRQLLTQLARWATLPE